MRTLSAAVLLAVMATSGFAKDIFVAPGGKEGDAGTIEQPVGSVMRAQELANAGDTVYFRGGTYAITEKEIAKKSGIFAYVFDISKSGKKDAPIRYAAYKDEKPKFDFSAVKPANLRVIAFYVSADWVQFKGLDLTGVQVTITGHTQSEFFENHGSNNLYEQCLMHDSQAIGFYLLNGSNNLVLNCDAWNNHDYTSEGGRGGNTDGFGCHPRKGAENNVFRGCRAWYNSDDGYDCINAAEVVTFENCWAMYNGLSPKGESLGDGNGFKAGGYGATPTERLPNPIPRHVVKFCIAVGNKNSGFYSNHHTGGVDFFNNTAYRNGVNFNFLERTADNKTDVPGKGHRIINNLGFMGKREAANLAANGNELRNNSFPTEMGLKEGDFESLDEKQLVGPRKGDGGLPEVMFMRPKGGPAAAMGAFAKNHP